jgi:hypothetical protein
MICPTCAVLSATLTQLLGREGMPESRCDQTLLVLFGGGLNQW